MLLILSMKFSVLCRINITLSILYISILQPFYERSQLSLEQFPVLVDLMAAIVYVFSGLLM